MINPGGPSQAAGVVVFSKYQYPDVNFSTDMIFIILLYYPNIMQLHINIAGFRYLHIE